MSYLDGKGVSCEVSEISKGEAKILADTFSKPISEVSESEFGECINFLAARYQKVNTHAAHMMPLTFTTPSHKQFVECNQGRGLGTSKLLTLKAILPLEHSGDIRTEICGMFPVKFPLFNKVLTKVPLVESQFKSLRLLKVELLERTSKIYLNMCVPPTHSLYFTHNVAGGGMCGTLEIELRTLVNLEY